MKRGALQRSHRATCRRHKPFPNEGQAFAHLLDKIRANEVDPGTTTFFCTHCQGWHIGHSGGQGSKSLERLVRERQP